MNFKRTFRRALSAVVLLVVAVGFIGIATTVADSNSRSAQLAALRKTANEEPVFGPLAKSGLSAMQGKMRVDQSRIQQAAAHAQRAAPATPEYRAIGAPVNCSKVIDVNVTTQ